MYEGAGERISIAQSAGIAGHGFSSFRESISVLTVKNLTTRYTRPLPFKRVSLQI